MKSMALHHRLRSPTREECRLAQDDGSTQSGTSKSTRTTSASTTTVPPAASGVTLLAMRRSGPPTSLTDTLRLLHRDHAYEHRSLALNCQALTEHLMRSAQQQQEQLLQRAARPRIAAPRPSYAPARPPTVERVGGMRGRAPYDEERRPTFAPPRAAKGPGRKDAGTPRRAAGRRLTHDTLSDIEAAEFRSGVTNKLIDLMDEVCELHACRQNMHDQIFDAMRLDPRWSRSVAGQTRLARRPTHEQVHALDRAVGAFEALQATCVELVASYLTPEEKRYLGIDTHRFQTRQERATTYQYVDPTPAHHPTRSSSTSTSRGGSRSDSALEERRAASSSRHRHPRRTPTHRHRRGSREPTRSGTGARSRSGSRSRSAASSATHSSHKRHETTTAVRSGGRPRATTATPTATTSAPLRQDKRSGGGEGRVAMAASPLSQPPQTAVADLKYKPPSAVALPSEDTAAEAGTPERAYGPVVSASTIGNGELSTSEAPRPVAAPPSQPPPHTCAADDAARVATAPQGDPVAAAPTAAAAAAATKTPTPPLSARRAMIQRLLVDSDSDSEA